MLIKSQIVSKAPRPNWLGENVGLSLAEFHNLLIEGSGIIIIVIIGFVPITLITGIVV